MRRSIQFPRMYENKKAFENEDVLYSVMTRFNIIWNPKSMMNIRETPKIYHQWLIERVALFRELCLRPMLQQSIKPHAWFLLFDAEINRVIARLLDDLLDHEWIIPLFFGPNCGDAILSEFREVSARRFGDRGFTHSCCVRLDSDDSLNVRYMGLLDQAVTTLRPEWNPDEVQTINFPYGAAKLHDRFLIDHQPRQFFAIFEPLDNAKTPYRVGHRHIGDVSDVWDILTPQPMYIYQAHDSNISNVARWGRKKDQPFGDIPLLLDQFGMAAPQTTVE